MLNSLTASMSVVLCLLFSTPLFAADANPAPAAQAGEDQTAEEMLAAEAALEAQEAQADGGDETPPDEAANADAADAPVAATGASGPADEDFVPTIQISEDLSVSFPVDI